LNGAPGAQVTKKLRHRPRPTSRRSKLFSELERPVSVERIVLVKARARD
jgi:hypothetical protein